MGKEGEEKGEVPGGLTITPPAEGGKETTGKDWGKQWRGEQRTDYGNDWKGEGQGSTG